MEQGNRFKFIERSAEIEAHRGVRVDDGLVRIEWKIERVRPIQEIPVPHYCPVPRPYYPPQHPKQYPILRSNRPGPPRPMHPTSARASASTNRERDSVRSMRELGITVPGSVSNQKFSYGQWFETTGISEVLIIKLIGEVGGSPVTAPVTVDKKRSAQHAVRKVSSLGTIALDVELPSH